jgi:hypothetical protein
MGKRHGKGRQTYGGRPPDGFGGDIYEGDWVRDMREGKGTLSLANGDVYQGDWKQTGLLLLIDTGINANYKLKSIKRITTATCQTNVDVYQGDWKHTGLVLLMNTGINANDKLNSIKRITTATCQARISCDVRNVLPVSQSLTPSCMPRPLRVRNLVRNSVRNLVRTVVQNRVPNRVRNLVLNRIRNLIRNLVRNSLRVSFVIAIAFSRKTLNLAMQGIGRTT